MLKNVGTSGKSRVAVVLVIFALLAFTAVRTSPLTTGLESGSSLSKTTPKQRYMSIKEIDWIVPVLTLLLVVAFDFGELVPSEQRPAQRDQFSGRYFSLPPPR